MGRVAVDVELGCGVPKRRRVSTSDVPREVYRDVGLWWGEGSVVITLEYTHVLNMY